MSNNEILMPALSPTMEEGTLAKWLVKVGDKISSGDLIAEIETDKATMEIEAIEEGFISKLIVEEGAQGIKINTPIAEFSDNEKFSEINDDDSNKNVINISNKEVIEDVKSSVIETSDKDLTSSKNGELDPITTEIFNPLESSLSLKCFRTKHVWLLVSTPPILISKFLSFGFILDLKLLALNSVNSDLKRAYLEPMSNLQRAGTKFLYELLLLL